MKAAFASKLYLPTNEFGENFIEEAAGISHSAGRDCVTLSTTGTLHLK